MYNQKLTVTAPDGSKPVNGAWAVKGSVWILESTQPGTYKVLLDPQGTATGTTSVQLESAT